jgi:hypothetical protein
MAGAAYYFDNWMWGGKKVRGARIGAISSKTGDVRVKFEGDLKWAKAARGQDLVYNDSIYAGGGSQAELALGQSQMTVQENTLIVLRREKDVSFLNLDYGTLFGKVAKDDKIMIDTGSGKPIEFSTKSNAQIVLRKTQGGKTELNVISGTADVVINGKTQRVTNSSKIVLDERAPTPEPKIESARLVALKPLKGDFLYANAPMDIPFQWEWSNKRPAQAGETFTLEFSAEPTFQKIHASKAVTGRLGAEMHASKSLSLYYRVRGPRAELSQVERVNFVRMQPPVIVKPVAGQKFLTPAGQNALIEVEFNKAPNANVWYQIAGDAGFAQILMNQSTREAKVIPELAAGSYWLRARHDYGNNRVSDWSAAQPFQIDPKLDQLRLTEVPARDRVLIPNKPYPGTLYKASAAKVRAYLSKNGFLKNYFPFKAGSFDQLKIAFDNESQAIAQPNADWPQRAMAPGSYTYKYQATKTGFEPSPVAGPKKLDIAMEAPRAVGKANFGEPLEDGSREAQWAFTPLLFARSYDVEVARDPSFRGSKQLKVESPLARAQLNPGPHYWRARARDGQGRIISDYSAPERIEVPQMVPQALAENSAEADRQPAAADSNVLKIDDKPAEPWVRNGWWAWLGSGYNYVDYRQSVQDRGTVTSHSPRAASQYFEGGYNGSTGWGGVVSYKGTPGEITVENAALDKANYTWSTLGIEGFKRSLNRLPFTNVPVVYGVRVGIQQHKTPFLFLDADTNLQLKQNRMNTASFGLLAEVQRRKWTYYWLMRYQYPFSSVAEGSNQFEIKPTFAFDGSIGTSYNFTQRLKVGVFWYGQWHQYDFVYGDGNVTNVGFQSLFYSNVDLRLGFDF